MSGKQDRKEGVSSDFKLPWRTKCLKFRRWITSIEGQEGGNGSGTDLSRILNTQPYPAPEPSWHTAPPKPGWCDGEVYAIDAGCPTRPWGKKRQPDPVWILSIWGSKIRQIWVWVSALHLGVAWSWAGSLTLRSLFPQPWNRDKWVWPHQGTKMIRHFTLHSVRRC